MINAYKQASNSQKHITYAHFQSWLKLLLSIFFIVYFSSGSCDCSCQLFLFQYSLLYLNFAFLPPPKLKRFQLFNGGKQFDKILKIKCHKNCCSTFHVSVHNHQVFILINVYKIFKYPLSIYLKDIYQKQHIHYTLIMHITKKGSC